MRGLGGVAGAGVEVVRAGVDTCRVRGAGAAPGEATGTAPGGGGKGRARLRHGWPVPPGQGVYGRTYEGLFRQAVQYTQEVPSLRRQSSV